MAHQAILPLKLSLRITRKGIVISSTAGALALLFFACEFYLCVAPLPIKHVCFLLLSRLTSSTPFIEDEAQRDMKVRIAERVIDWGALDSAGVSDLGQPLVPTL